LEELVDGSSYVVSSTPKLQRIDYLSITSPTWNSANKPIGGSVLFLSRPYILFEKYIHTFSTVTGLD